MVFEDLFGMSRYLDQWVQAVNAHGGFGRWRWAVVKSTGEIRDILL
jgi:type III restriction enzyme